MNNQYNPIDTGSDVREKHKFDENKLREYLENKIDGFTSPLSVKQFSGGQSNPTYILTLPNAKYVLRRKPEGNLLPSAHAIDREYKVISAVYSVGYKVAKPHLYCDDESIIGSQFYVSDYLHGRVYFDRSMPNVKPAERTLMLKNFIATMAQLHKIDHKSIGLSDFGREGNYFARQISRWSKQYKMSETQKIKSMDYLIDWLPKNIPGEDINILIHGDYSLHNVMMHPTEPELLAVLDWELSTTGDPMGDLFYALQPWYSPLEATSKKSNAELIEHGFPVFEDMLDMYCESAGVKKIQHVAFYQAYNLFRSAAILQGIIGRVRDGTAARSDADTLAASVQPLADNALALVS